MSATNFIAWSEKPKWPEVLKPKKNLRTWGSKAVRQNLDGRDDLTAAAVQ